METLFVPKGMLTTYVWCSVNNGIPQGTMLVGEFVSERYM